MSKKKRFGGWEIIEESRKGRRLKRRSKMSQKEKKGKQAASCMSQFSQLRHFLDNPTVHIEDLWVENNISKFQLNPTVDEVAMAVFPKEVCLAPAQRLASAWRRQKTGASAWTAPRQRLEAPEVRGLAPGQRLRRQNTQTQHKTRFSDASFILSHPTRPQT